MNDPVIRPARCLPDWARVFMDEWRTGSRRVPIGIDDNLPHRRDAFYRLYFADDRDVRALWRNLSRQVENGMPRGFIMDLILATDAIVTDEPLPVYARPALEPLTLRTRAQRHARKLAELLQLLAAVTPPRCRAARSRIMLAGSDIEYLVIYFNIGAVPRDYDLRWQRQELGISYTSDSERGWRQHRRASDKVRRRTIRTARILADILAETKHHGWLLQLATDLDQLPDMHDEHAGWLTLMSQKHGWWNWLAAAYALTHAHVADEGWEALGPSDWATLARVITGTEDITPDDVAHALADLRANPAGVSEFLKNVHGIDAE